MIHGLNWKECLAYLDDVIVLGNLTITCLFEIKKKNAECLEKRYSFWAGLSVRMVYP